jgi:DNA-binding PadR family transcriptional regulator
VVLAVCILRDTIYRMTSNILPPKEGFDDPSLLILLSLLDGPKHGYGITMDLKESFNVKLGPGTLYGALKVLCDKKLIEPIASHDRRKPYRITDVGRAFAAEHVAVWDTVTQVGNRRLRSA